MRKVPCYCQVVVEVHVSYVASTATKVEEEEVKGEEGKKIVTAQWG